MTVVVLRPVAAYGSGVTAAGAANILVAVNDDDDSSYLENFYVGNSAFFDTDVLTVPAGGVIKQAALRVRVSKSDPGYPWGKLSVAAMIASDFRISSEIVDYWLTPVTVTVGTVSAVGSRPLAESDFLAAGLRVAAVEQSFGIVRVHELYLDVTYVAQPVAAPSAPSGTVTDTNLPTVAWANTLDADGGPQTFSQVKVFTAAQYGAGGFNPATSTATIESGIAAGSGVSGEEKVGSKRDWLPGLPNLSGLLPGLGDLPEWIKGTGKWLIKKAKSYISDKVKGLFGGGGGAGGSGGPSGLGSFDGLQVANWIVPILQWARTHGWGGRLTSGYRSHAYNVAQGRNYYSNHEGVNYPGGAVDVGGWGAKTEGAALASVLAGYRGNRRLVWAGPTIGDWGHFSANGHKKGAIIGGDGASLPPFVGSYKDGGVIPRDGLALVHQGETVTPADATGMTFAPRFFIGDREITDLVRVEMDERERRQFQTFAAGGVR